ncbi:MAG: hypothetical protein ACXW33_06285 [Sulfuricurvum sp.]
MQTCTQLEPGEILNGSHTQWPLFEGIIYGDATLSLKLAKRLVCGVKHLPLRLSLKTITDTHAAIEAGVASDPTLFINGKPFIQGLVAAETLTASFEILLKESL